MTSQTCLILISLFFVLPCQNFVQQGTIQGKVRAPSGTPLTGVIVELWHRGSHLNQTVTTGEGDFYFSSLMPDTYEIVVSHQGYQRVAEQVSFRFPGNTSQREVLPVEIRLRLVESEKAAHPPGTTFAQNVPAEARAPFKSGVEKIGEGKSGEGIKLLQQAVQIFPDYFDANFALATELSKESGRDQAALESLERARSVNDRDARVWHLFGIIMARREKFTVAEYAFRQAVERDPMNAQSRFSHGLTLLEVALRTEGQEQQSALATAERELQKALDLTGQKLVAAYLHLARICELRGDRKAASEMLETYLKLNPEDKNAPAIREAMAKLKSWRPLR
jgi:Tfp pilus assembly protein PilF